MYTFYLQFFEENEKYEISSDEQSITLATLIYLASQQYRRAEIDEVNLKVSLQTSDRDPLYVFSLEDDTPLARDTKIDAEKTVIVARLILVFFRIQYGDTDLTRIHPATTVEEFTRMRNQGLMQKRYYAFLTHTNEPEPTRVKNWKTQVILNNDTIHFVAIR